MTPRTRAGRIAAAAVLVVAGLLLTGLVVALGWTTALVDEVPGADAGLATSPELEAARSTATLLGFALLTLAAVTGAVLARRARTRRAADRRSP